ncbi:hypothetical protein THASP1DRAFT_27765 [Thamnocephalis sphaerospora]|uniref:Uncharacterized protein n=1 Tax=Thamnocephalis sphaerospora TaxID=78915 RepID=A0A4P9XVW7_9FUNG|nr:hypothetical protein THASP1DRAFT_27765 [Thamnocephalis sphaerospora]|eukprot:RKP10437.1 hypothetical protein THASP1DRAFT_27765 [Thamnocephalis sphaerospora]
MPITAITDANRALPRPPTASRPVALLMVLSVIGGDIRLACELGAGRRVDELWVVLVALDDVLLSKFQRDSVLVGVAVELARVADVVLTLVLDTVEVDCSGDGSVFDAEAVASLADADALVPDDDDGDGDGDGDDAMAVDVLEGTGVASLLDVVVPVGVLGKVILACELGVAILANVLGVAVLAEALGVTVLGCVLSSVVVILVAGRVDGVGALPTPMSDTGGDTDKDSSEDAMLFEAGFAPKVGVTFACGAASAAAMVTEAAANTAKKRVGKDMKEGMDEASAKE